VSLVSLALQNLRARNATVIARSLGSVVIPQCSCQLCISASCCMRHLFLRKCSSHTHLPAPRCYFIPQIPYTRTLALPNFYCARFPFWFFELCAFGLSHRCVCEVSVLQEYDAASMGHWFPIADKYLRAGNINFKNLFYSKFLFCGVSAYWR